MPSQPGSSDAAQLGAPLSHSAPGSSYPVRSQPSSGLSSRQVSPLLTKDQQEALRAVRKSSQLLQSASSSSCTAPALMEYSEHDLIRNTKHLFGIQEDIPFPTSSYPDKSFYYPLGFFLWGFLILVLY